MIGEQEGRREAAGPEGRTWYTTAEAGKKLGVTPERVRQLIKAGVLAGKREGHGWLVSQGAIEGWKRPKRGGKRTAGGTAGTSERREVREFREWRAQMEAKVARLKARG